MTSFVYRFDELITNYNDVADTTDIIQDDEKKFVTVALNCYSEVYFAD